MAIAANPITNQPYSKGILDRFWSKVEKTDTCWLWTGATTKCGYGVLKIGGRKGKPVYAHRLSLEIHSGKPLEAAHVVHRCDNPRCVNPAHLFPGTNQDNIADMVAKGRQARGEKSGSARLTAEQVGEIQALSASGVGPTEISKQYGVHSNTVRSIVRGRTWQVTK